MKRMIYISVILTTMLIFSVGNAKAKNDYIELASSMNDIRKSENSLLGDFIGGIQHVENLINGKPDISGFHSTVEKLNLDFQLYKQSAERLRMVLKKNKENLKGWEEYGPSLKNVSTETVNKTSEMVDAFKVLLDNIKQEEFSVYASENWANSGITVKTGDVIYVEASGGWTVSANYNAAGVYGYLDTLNSAYSRNPQFPLGALLYRVRGSVNQAGSGFNENLRGMADSDGRLEFSINDNDLRNNSGQLKLAIVIYNMNDISRIFELAKDQSVQ